MVVKNPRFPHWCRIVRKTTDDPMEDEEDFSPLDSVGRTDAGVESDDDYDPMGGDDSDDVIGNPVDDTAHVVEDDTENDSVGESHTTIIYEGICRSYKINTTSDKGDVITSQRGLSLPLNQEGWDRIGMVPMEGDEVIVVHGSSFKEYGRVVDKNVATANFGGTHLVWRYGRN